MDVLKCANQEKSLDKNVIYCVPSQPWMSKRSKAILESTKCKICHNKNSLEGVINISHWWHCIVSIFSFLVQIFCKSNVCITCALSIVCTFKVAAKFATISRLFSDHAERASEVCVRNIRGARGMWPGWRRRGRDCAVKCTWGLFPAALIGWNVGNVGRNAGIGPSTLSHTHTHQHQGRRERASAKHWWDVRNSGGSDS